MVAAAFLQIVASAAVAMYVDAFGVHDIFLLPLRKKYTAGAVFCVLAHSAVPLRRLYAS